MFNSILLNLYIFTAVIAILAVAIFLLQRYQKKNQISQFEIALKKHTKKINEAEQRFNKLFDDAGVGIALIELNGKIFRVNDTLSRLLCYTESELLALNYFDLLKDKDLEELRIHIQNLQADRLKVYQAEQQLITRKNEEV